MLTLRQRLAHARLLATIVRTRAQGIRIVQAQACTEAKWSRHLRDRADRCWQELNEADESLTAELAKLQAEVAGG